jgi:hypothetical protein
VTARRVRRHGAGAQRGAAFYLFVVLTLTMTAMLFSGAAAMRGTDARAAEAERVLADARRAVLAYLTQPDVPWVAADAGRRLGDWRLTPDLPIAAGAGDDAAEPVLDGLSDAGCATRTWTPGGALSPPSASGAAARCFGRLPWRTLGVAPVGEDSPESDPRGTVPWLVISPNLVAGRPCVPDLNPLMLSADWGGFACPTTLPWPWLRVVDERGNLLSDRVAFALVLPGPPVDGQVRGPAAGPAAFLDALTVTADCVAPCEPGTYSNAAFSHADGVPTTLVRGPAPGSAAARVPGLAQPLRFNDRLVYVTADELLEALEARARAELVARLTEARVATGAFPWGASLDTPDGACVTGLRVGHPPTQCASGPAPALPAWFTDGGWHRYFVYAVSPRCTPVSGGCTAPGLRVGARTDVEALVLAPGRAIRAAPFAPSKLLAQAPLSGLLPSPLLRDYLDTVENADGDDTFESIAVPSTSVNDRLTVVR